MYIYVYICVCASYSILDFKECNNHIKLYSEIYDTKSKQVEVFKEPN